MDIQQFQLKSVRTMKIDDGTIPHCALGLAGEVGEVVDLVKKSVYYEKAMDLDHLEEEIGDVMFYLVNLATMYNLPMDKILEKNVEKLEKRYPSGFSKKDAIERKDKL